MTSKTPKKAAQLTTGVFLFYGDSAVFQKPAIFDGRGIGMIPLVKTVLFV